MEKQRIYLDPEPKTIRKKGAFGIIFNEKGEVLLCHRRDYDLYNLPGGRVENGEDPNQDEKPIDAVLREVVEETGVHARILRPGHMYYRRFPHPSIAFTYVCELIDSENIGNTDESDDTRFFPLDALPYNLIPTHAQRIQDVLRETTPLFKIEHDYTLPEIVSIVHQGRR